MKAAWYEKQGAAREVLEVGETPDPAPGPGEVRSAVQCSGINPGDVKKRSDAFGVGMPFPRVIPHSDGSGYIDTVGDGVSPIRAGERVWCFGAQSYRPFGTAAGFTVVPEQNAVRLPDGASFEQGACLGIPGLTAHRAVHIAGRVRDLTVLIQGGAGAVGSAAVSVARHAGARVVATVRSAEDEGVAEAAGAHDVVRTDGAAAEEVMDRIMNACPAGVDHIIEVAFHANVAVDERVLRQGGSVASYATGDPNPSIPFWPLVFKNIRLYFLGSDDFPISTRGEAGAELSAMLEEGWTGPQVSSHFTLDEIASAHEAVEQGNQRGRVVLDLSRGSPQQNRM